MSVWAAALAMPLAVPSAMFQLINLKSVEGKNYAGGFIGLSGPGELVGTDGGLTVNLLGLNYLLKLNNLLSLGQAVGGYYHKRNVKGIGDGLR